MWGDVSTIEWDVIDMSLIMMIFTDKFICFWSTCVFICIFVVVASLYT